MPVIFKSFYETVPAFTAWQHRRSQLVTPTICSTPEEPAAQMGDSNAETGKEQQNVPAVTFKLQFGKNSTELSMPLSATVGDIKEQAHRLLSIPPAMQKLLIKGSIKPDTTTLQDAGIKKGLRVMLIGSRCSPNKCYLLNFACRHCDAHWPCFLQTARYSLGSSTCYHTWSDMGFTNYS